MKRKLQFPALYNAAGAARRGGALFHKTLGSLNYVKIDIPFKIWPCVNDIII